MIGQQFSSRQSKLWAQTATWVLFATLIGGLFWGPPAIYLCSIVGILVCLLGLFLSWRYPDRYIRGWKLGLFLCGFLFTSVVGLTLEALFLSPIQDESLKIPPLNQPFTDADAFFSIRAPQGWSLELKNNNQGSGFILQPSLRSQYMGVSEVSVLVKENEKPIINSDQFLAQLAGQLQNPQRVVGKAGIFNIHVATISLLDGSLGLVSEFTAKKLWIPIKQVAIIGVKEKKYLCTVSAVGLESHATLAQVLCQGLYKTIQFDSVP